MSAPHRTKEFFLEALRREGAAFRAAVSRDRLDEPVPPCPDWAVRDLVGHLGSVYRWHGANVARGVTTKPDGARPADFPADDELLAWWDDAFAGLVATLEAVDPQLPAWNWSVQAPQAAFWHRRMAHETAIHRWDAQVAAGLAEPVPMELAVDGVDEVLDSFLPAGRRLGRLDLTGVVRLEATDAANRWAVRVRGVGLSLLDTDTLLDDEPHAQAAAKGTASDLLLALWGRIPLTTLTIQGTPELVTTLRTG